MRFVSLLAEPLESGYLRLAESWGCDCDRDPDWRAREARLREGRTDLAALCGLLFTLLRRQGLPIAPLASAVLDHPRYQGKPHYFVDLVARRRYNFEELSGRSMGVNDWNSLSGYHALRAHLQQSGRGSDWFGELRPTGSHRRSLAQLKAGQVEFVCLDSTFWDFLPPLEREGLVVCQTLGPFPAPLLASLNGARANLEMGTVAAPLAELVPVKLSDYEPIEKLWEASQALEEG